MATYSTTNLVSRRKIIILMLTVNLARLRKKLTKNSVTIAKNSLSMLNVKERGKKENCKG